MLPPGAEISGLISRVGVEPQEEKVDTQPPVASLGYTTSCRPSKDTVAPAWTSSMSLAPVLPLTIMAVYWLALSADTLVGTWSVASLLYTITAEAWHMPIR